MWISIGFVSRNKREIDLGSYLFFISLILICFSNWQSVANHIWLLIWIFAGLIFLNSGGKTKLVRDYVRLTLGLVMFSAAIQKVVSGTYIDGSFLAYLTQYGSYTEAYFGNIICKDLDPYKCTNLSIIGTSVIIWQIVIALLLFFNVMNRWVAILEVLFLVSVGVYADELNFQIINIALFCIAFGFKLNLIQFLSLIFIVLVDVVTLHGVITKYLL